MSVPTTDAPLTGACRCGAVRMEVVAAPFMTAACHCTGCQRMTSSAFSLTMMVNEDGFGVTAGEVVVGGAGSDELTHYCCPKCHTWVFTRVPGMDFVNVRSALFDDPRWTRPFLETMTAERLPWATTPAERSYEGFPSFADFPELIAAFRAARL